MLSGPRKESLLKVFVVGRIARDSLFLFVWCVSYEIDGQRERERVVRPVLQVAIGVMSCLISTHKCRGIL